MPQTFKHDTMTEHPTMGQALDMFTIVGLGMMATLHKKSTSQDKDELASIEHDFKVLIQRMQTFVLPDKDIRM